MCLTSNLAKAQLLESLRPHPTSLASHSPEMLRKRQQFGIPTPRQGMSIAQRMTLAIGMNVLGYFGLLKCQCPLLN